jgi:hypothetical protein
MPTMEINLQPPTQVIPTSNERGTPMVERRPELNPPQYVSQFQQRMPNQQTQLQRPGQRQRPHVLDTAGRQTTRGQGRNATLPAEEDVSFGQHGKKNEQRLSISQQASIERLLNSKSPVSRRSNALQPVNLSPAMQQPAQHSVTQQPLLPHSLQSPPQLVPSIQSTSRLPQRQPPPPSIAPLGNEPETPHPLVIEQPKQQPVVPQSAGIPSPSEVPAVDTAGKDPLLSSEDAVPNILANSSNSHVPKEADSQISPKEMSERPTILPPKKSPPSSTPRTVTNSPTTKKSDLKQIPPLTSSQQSLQEVQEPNTERETLLAALKSIRPPLTERESSAINRLFSLNLNQKSLFAALVVENIIPSESLGQFRTIFASIEAILFGSIAPPAQYHCPLPLPSSDNTPAQTKTPPPNSSLNQSDSAPLKPESTSTMPKPSTTQTQSTPPKSSPKQTVPPATTPPSRRLQLPMPSPILKERITKLFLQYAMETQRPECIGSITSLAKTAKTIFQLETAMKDQGIFSAQEIAKVEQRAVMELRKERENVQSSQSTSNDAMSEIGETSLENISSLTVQLAKDSSAQKIGAPHVKPVSENAATKVSNVDTVSATNVQKANTGSPSDVITASQAPTAQDHIAKRSNQTKVRSATQNPRTDASNQIANGLNPMNAPNINDTTTSTNGTPSNSFVGNGKEDITSNPSAPQVQQRRARKLKSESAVIAQALPNRSDLDLSKTIASWPENQIARNILIAAGREIPGEETAPLNEEFESIKVTWPELKKADLRTLEWDLIDPPRVDLVTAMRKTLESARGLLKDSMTSGRGRGGPSIKSSPLVPSSLPSTQSGTDETSKLSDIDNRSSYEPVKTQQLNLPPPMSSEKGLIGTATGSASAPGGISPGGLGRGRLRSQSSLSVSPVAPIPSVPKPPSTTSTPGTHDQKPKSHLPTTAVQIAEVTPTKLTPQVVDAPPPKSTTPATVSVADDDVIDVTPTKPSSKNASPRESARNRRVKRNTPSPITKSTPKRSTVNNLTKDVPRATRTPKRTPAIDRKTIIPLATPLNQTDSSDNEFPRFTPTPPEPVKNQAGYNYYSCRWQACGAELDCFDTLERHIIKVHGKPDPVTNVSSKRGCADFR